MGWNNATLRSPHPRSRLAGPSRGGLSSVAQWFFAIFRYKRKWRKIQNRHAPRMSSRDMATLEKTLHYFLFAAFFLFPSTDHLGARNVTVLVDEVEVSPTFLMPTLATFLVCPPFLPSRAIFRARHAAVLVHKVEVKLFSFFLLNAYLFKFRYL